MSTRAVYTIHSSRVRASFYLHHDGYPEGAAIYFHNAIQHSDFYVSRLFLDHFFRANDRAELVAGPEQYGDLEFIYYYSIETDGLIAEKRIHSDDEKDLIQYYEVFYHGPLVGFINKYMKLPNDSYKKIKLGSAMYIMSKGEIEEKINKLKQDKACEEKGERMHQARFIQENIDIWQKQFDEFEQ